MTTERLVTTAMIMLAVVIIFTMDQCGRPQVTVVTEATPTRLPVTVLPTQPVFLPPTWPPTAAPAEVRASTPLPTVTATSTRTPTPTVTPTVERSPVQRG